MTIEAVGMTADRLPLPPELHAPGILSFRGPVDRATEITEDGPVAKATYRWDLRPATGAPAQLPAITVPWFDTGERRMREAAVPERWVAYLGTFVHTRLERIPSFRERILKPGPIAAGLAGFAWTTALVGFLVSRGPQDSGGRRRQRLLSRLSRAARSGDEGAFRAAAAELARREPARWARVAAQPDIAQRLAAFDSARYGRGGAAAPALSPLAADIRRAWRAADVRVGRGAQADLPPLDGDVAAATTWRTVLRERLDRLRSRP